MTEQEYYDLYGQPPRGAYWAAEAIVKVTDAIGRGIEFIADQFRETTLDNAKTPEQVIDYANRIRDRHPSFANELIAAANRAQHSQE